MTKTIFLKLIRFYQTCPLLHGRLLRVLFLSDSICRFQPSCSEYSFQAIERYGILKGSWLGLKRIVCCHPWSLGGFDPLK